LKQEQIISSNSSPKKAKTTTLHVVNIEEIEGEVGGNNLFIPVTKRVPRKSEMGRRTPNGKENLVN